MKKGRTTPTRGANAQFISDTTHMIEKLTEARSKIAADQRANTVALQGLEQQWKTLLDSVVQRLLPNLEPLTLSRLERDMPSSYVVELKRHVAAAQNVHVPFWTWLRGGSAAFKQGELDALLVMLKTQLREWLIGRKPVIVFAKYGADGLSEKIASLTAAQSDLTARYKEINDQIEKLDAVRARYLKPDSPEPPKDLSDAVSRGSDAMKANPSVITTRDDTFWRDLYIINALTQSSHHDDDHYRRGGSGDYAPTPTASPWGSPSDSSSRDGGRASTRMDDAAPIPEGRSSARMSDAAPQEEGRSSARMSDAPLRADPFSEGRSSQSMSRETRDDTPSPSSRGTSY